MRTVLKAQINKTGRNDARGIAQMMRAGLYRPVQADVLATYFQVRPLNAPAAFIRPCQPIHL
jgi:hypothetical protein